MMKYSNIAELVKNRLPDDIKPVMEFYGIEFNRHGFAICPFHSEKTASLSTKGNFYKCFGCGASGDAISFVQQLYDESFINAVKRLNHDFGLGIGTDKPETTAEVVRRRKEQERKRQEREQFELLYSRVCAEYRRLYHAYIHDVPKPNEPIKSSYVEACHRLPYLEWWFDTHPYRQ